MNDPITETAGEDSVLWALVASTGDTVSIPTDLDVVFRRQPKPVDARHRVAYRTALLVLVLARFNRRAAKLSSLHTMMWATRSSRTRRMFSAWWDGRRSYNTLTERIDPDLEITLNLALIDGVVEPVGQTARVRLTTKGSQLAGLIAADQELLRVEKSFLDTFSKMSDTALEKKLGVTPH